MLRRDKLCDPKLCPDAADDGGRCEHCPLDQLDEAQHSEAGQLLHVALVLVLAACQKGYRVRFTTAAALVHELMEAKDEKRLLRFQKLLAGYDLVIVVKLGFVPLSKTGAEMLFEIFSLRYERGSMMVTSNLPFNEWTEVLGS